jgi:hypothetical protein
MAETTSKAPAPKKATARSTKAGAVDAKAEPKKAATKKVAPAAGNGKAAKPAAVKKTPAPRKPAATKASAGKKLVSDEQRYRMIAEAAYFRAESRQFQSDPIRDWIEAERDIAILLSESE